MASFDEKYPIVEDEESQNFNDSDYPVVDYGFNEQPREPPVDFSAMEMMRNVPSSAKNYGESLYNAVRHPIDTAKGVGNLAMGVAQKAIPGEQDKEVYADMMAKAIVERYGSYDKFKQTLMEDPVGVVTDLSLVLTGGGGAVSAIGKIPKVGSTVGKVGSAVTKAGMAIDPFNAALNTAKVPFSKTPKDLPNKIYQKGAKMGGTVDDVMKNTQTALDYNIMPTTKGLVKLRNVVDEFENTLDTLIKRSPQSNQKVNKNVLYSHIDEISNQLGGVAFDAPENLAKAQKLLNNFDSYLKESNKKWLTIKEIQDFKRKAYDSINWKPGRKSVGKAKRVTTKQVARAAKESIENAIPDTKEVNKQLGRLYELTDPVEKSAANIMRSGPTSLRAPLNILAAEALSQGHPAGVMAGGVLSLLENPKVMSKAGLMLNDIQKQGILGGYAANSPLLYALRQGALAGEDINSLLGQQ